MIKKIGLAALITSSLISNHAFSTTQHALTASMDITYQLQPNIPQVLTNITWWPINASCVLSVNNKIAPLSVMASRKPSSVDGSPLPLDEKIALEVQDKQVLLITAHSGATVELVNMGESVIEATCSTST